MNGDLTAVGPEPPYDTTPDVTGAARSRWLWITPFAAAFALCGVGLRVYMYLANRSFFIDEAALALNIRDRSFAELLAPMDYAQTAPFGFLWAQKALLLAFGQTEFVLRAMPLLAGVASIPLFMVLARRALPAHLLTPAIALFAFGEFPIYWASDVKPYSIDLAGCLLLLVLMIRFEERNDSGRVLALGLAGAILPWFSHASVLVLAGLAVRLAWLGLRGRMRAVVRMGLFWVLGLPAVWLAFRSLGAENQEYFRAYWNEGFLPMPWKPGAYDAWLEVISHSLYDPLGFRWVWHMQFATACILAGFVWLAAKRRTVFCLLSLPVAVALMASLSGRYPLTMKFAYSGRLVLFLMPSFCMFAIAAGAWIPRRRIGVALAGFLVFLASVPGLATLPYSRGDVRPTLDYVAARARSTDTAYMYYGMRLAADWYQPPIRAAIVNGVCSQVAREGYVEDLERLRGTSRLWVIMGYDFFAEQGLFFEYMDANARLLESSDSLRVAQARLYDFTDQARVPLKRELLTPPVYPDPGTDCRGVFAAPPPLTPP